MRREARRGKNLPLCAGGASVIPFLIGLGIALAILAVWYGYWIGAKDGWKQGRDEGRKQSDNWWIGAEQQVEEVRKEIWREDARKKEWP